MQAYLIRHNKPEGLQVSTYLLPLFGWMTLGIMYLAGVLQRLYLQNAVNATYNQLNGL